MYKDIYEEANRRLEGAAKRLGVSVFKFRELLQDEIGMSVKDYKKANTNLSKKVQKQMDTMRIERKELRHDTRTCNAMESLGKAILTELKKEKTECKRVKEVKLKGKAVGIIQITDTHFNEEVNLPFNKYNWDIASSRLRTHILMSVEEFKAKGIKKVLIAMTGDLLNSDRRLDEILMNSTNRANAMIGVVELLTQAIKEVVDNGFDVSYTYVAGNESRIDLDMGNENILISNSFDDMIADVLSYKLPKEVKYIKPNNSYEQVIEVNGFNILLVHGHSFKKNPEETIKRIMSNYAREGVIIHYCMFGHIHSAFIGDFFARSGGLVGSNGYSNNGLSLHGRANQISYVVSDFINPMLHDLQDSKVKGYQVDERFKTYKLKDKPMNMIINKVLV